MYDIIFRCDQKYSILHIKLFGQMRLDSQIAVCSRENRGIKNQRIWCKNVDSLWNGRIIGSFIFEENLIIEPDIHFLETEFQEYLTNIPLAEIKDILFLQDGELS